MVTEKFIIYIWQPIELMVFSLFFSVLRRRFAYVWRPALFLRLSCVLIVACNHFHFNFSYWAIVVFLSLNEDFLPHNIWTLFMATSYSI